MIANGSLYDLLLVFCVVGLIGLRAHRFPFSFFLSRLTDILGELLLGIVVAVLANLFSNIR